MARIRTIKPEFPQSESMGRVSRDARLLFVQLWTICDDSGKARAASRMLSSLLFPYDDDAPKLIDEWLCELESEGCLTRYSVDGDTYLQVNKWLKHQKIDKPSASRLPQFVEASRKVAKPREPSCSDLVPRTLDLVPSTKKDSVASQLAQAPSDSPLDLKRELFTRGTSFLKTCGLKEPDARSMLGKWRKSAGDLEVLNALAIAEGAAVSEPIPYIQAILAGKSKTNGNGKQPISNHPLGVFGQLADELLDEIPSENYPSRVVS